MPLADEVRTYRNSTLHSGHLTEAERRPHSVEGATPEIKVKAQQNRKSGTRWSKAMRRGLGLDVLTCEHCGGKREVLKFITDTKVITQILNHLDLATSLPLIAP